MRWLIFLSRVAFISGIFMLFAFSLLFIKTGNEETTASSIFLAGYGLALLILPITGIIYLSLIILGKKPANFIPFWLIVANILFLLILLIFTFYINDPYYHQK